MKGSLCISIHQTLNKSVDMTQHHRLKTIINVLKYLRSKGKQILSGEKIAFFFKPNLPFPFEYLKSIFIKLGVNFLNLNSNNLQLSLSIKALPHWLSGKESVCNAGDSGSIPGSGRLPGEGNGNPLQYSCLGNPRNRADWWATVHGARGKSMTQLSY